MVKYLLKEILLIITFIIGGSFIVGSSTEVYMGNELGYFVSNKSILTLKPGSVMVIIFGYLNK